MLYTERRSCMVLNLFSRANIDERGSYGDCINNWPDDHETAGTGSSGK